jgi:ABC-type antimicrobial peptide transport system permease subunit
VVLVTVGLFGVTYFTVAQRTREFGVRLALGATAADLRRLVFGESLRLVAPGLALGLLAAGALASLAGSALVGVAPLDLRWYLAAAALQAGVTLLASWSPARRASRVSPQITLRGD